MNEILIGAGNEPDLNQQLKDAKNAYQEVIMGGGLDIAELALQGFLLASFAKAELNALRTTLLRVADNDNPFNDVTALTEDAITRASIEAIKTATATILGQVSTPVLANAAEIAAVKRR
jgi:hypothetical protein